MTKQQWLVLIEALTIIIMMLLLNIKGTTSKDITKKIESLNDKIRETL